MTARVLGGATLALTLTAVTWLYFKTQSVTPTAHAHIDSSLRELRSLDRTINQDVLRARYQLIDSYDPVLRSYRQIEELERKIAETPSYLDDTAKAAYSDAIAKYRQAVTHKQRLIEGFKYRAADLRSLLNVLPGMGAAVAEKATATGEDGLAREVNRTLQHALLYALTSDESHVPLIRGQLGALTRETENAQSGALRRQSMAFIQNVRRLLIVKPLVDQRLFELFDEPVIEHEDRVARTYYEGYRQAEQTASYNRVVLYALCLVMLVALGYALRSLQRTARGLVIANERLEERVAARTQELSMRNREMKTVLDVFHRMATDVPELTDFLTEGRMIAYQTLSGKPVDREAVVAGIHALRAGCAHFNVQPVIDICRELEPKLVDGGIELSEADLARVGMAWRTFENEMQQLLAEPPANQSSLRSLRIVDA